ncbi:homoserine kinase [Lentilactobacillus sp. Marseille-Q4993]|uniref:homoserine kinase n=1 Tax=Lentilactobacillus sp. Marseille-Q4993 TaxID=3039492 RepID=UPI0024BD538E|nr:homoserine kinase [Lentilactobacillus sp. Marseille-Q4993]
MIKIKVPATSANISVGFDCLGVAVAYYSTFEFDKSATKLEISGCDPKYQTADNLVYQAFERGCQYLEQPVPNVSIKIDSDVPVARGLGSSAVCIVAGLRAASAWFNDGISEADLLMLATEMEGHPDNVVPAILGGLQMSFLDNDEVPQVVSYQISDKLKFIAIIPDYPVSTDDAREALPKQLSYSDAVNQVSHFGLLIRALETGNLSQIKIAFNDKMHEPYRSKLIPDYDSVSNSVNENSGAFYISGSGSTMMAIADNNDQVTAITTALQEKHPEWRINEVAIDNTGVVSEVIDNGKVLYR